MKLEEVLFENVNSVYLVACCMNGDWCAFCYNWVLTFPKAVRAIHSTIQQQSPAKIENYTLTIKKPEK